MLRKLSLAGFCLPLLGQVMYMHAAPLSCSGDPASAPSIRATGFMELVGEVIVTCRGGTPAAAGAALPFKTVTITALDGAGLTSRTLGTSGGQTWTEAILAVDEPAPFIQQACEAADGRCAGRGNGTGTGTYGGRNILFGNPNLYQGQRVSPNAISFTIPWDDPGPSTNRLMRLMNLRVNANVLSFQANGTAPVRFRVDIDGSPIALSSSIIAFAQEPSNQFAAAPAFRPEGATVRHRVGSIAFQERWPDIWRRRTVALPVSDLPGPAASQDVLGTIYQTESGFVSRGLPNIPGRGNLADAGLANNGTRLMARITRIDPGVQLWVRALVSTNNGGRVRLMVSGGAGDESFTPASADSEGLAALTVSGGRAAAVWEVLTADTTVLDRLEVDVFATYPAGAAQVTVETLLAPAAFGDLAQAPSFAVPGGTAAGCSFRAANSLITVPATGGKAEVSIDTSPGCGWQVDFFANTPGSFVVFESSRQYWQGSGVARWRVLPNTGPPRALAVVVQGLNVTIYQRGGARTNLQPPTITAPAANQSVTSNAVTVSWQPPAGQLSWSGFGITIVRWGGFAGPDVVSELNAPASSSSALFSLPPGSYSVLARTCSGGFDDQSCGEQARVDFGVRTGSHPGLEPTVTSPANGAKLTRSTNELRWTPVAGATSYRVEIKGAFFIAPVASVRVDAPATSTILTLPSGNYSIRVRACSESCFLPPVSLLTLVGFTVELPPVPTTAPAVTQSSITQGNLLDVAWTAVPGADLYQVQVVQPSSGPGGGALTVAARQVSTTSVQMPVPSGPASILVSACTGDGCGPFSLPVPIQPPGPNPAAPVIGTPMSGVLTMGPAVLFTWGRVPGDNGTNTTYRLYVADLSLSGTAADVYTTSNFAAVQVQTDGRRYDAVVVAHPGQPNQIQGPPTGFQAGGSAPFAPVLVSPAHGGRVRQGMVRLGWAPFGDGPFQYYVSSVGGAYTASGTAAGTFVELPLAVLNGQPTVYSAVVRACGLDTFARNWYACDPASEQFWAPWSNSPGGSGVTMFTLLP